MKLRWNWAGVLRTLRDSAVTDRKCAGLYRPNDLDSRTRDLVIEVLRRKHPETRAPRSIRLRLLQRRGGAKLDGNLLLYLKEDVAK